MFNFKPRPAWPCVALALASCATSTSERRSSLSRSLDGPRAPEVTLSTSTLRRSELIAQTVAVNPSLDAARASVRAALAREPSASALDAPTLGYTLAPLSIGSSKVRFGQVITLGQRLPWPGKLSGASEVVLAEAEAKKEQVAQTRLELALAASTLFDAYYAVERALEVNRAHQRLVAEIRATAEAQYVAARAPQQDVLQAEVELSHVLHQEVMLRSQRSGLVAQLNGLLHRPPHLPLPPPPPSLPVLLDPPADSEALQQRALAERPALQAARKLIEGRRASSELADVAYYPDFNVVLTYNSMWAQVEHQWMAGLSLTLPFLQFGARRGQADEASAEVRMAEAKLARLVDQVRVEVEEARRKLLESQHVVQLYQSRLLVAARAHVAAARAGYETGQNGFQALVQAERTLRDLEIQYEEAVASVFSHHAALCRAVGVMPFEMRGGAS